MSFRSNAVFLAAALAAVSVATSADAARRHHHHIGMHSRPYVAADPASYGQYYGRPYGQYYGPSPGFDGGYRRGLCVPLGPDAMQCGGTRWEYHGGTAGM
jgi:hypothetical protein